MVLTDDNFATIVPAIEEGRRVYDNVRKFVFYIFATRLPRSSLSSSTHSAGGKVPLPLTALLILAIDLGTETLPALALGTRAGRARPHGPSPRAAAKASSGGRCCPRLGVPRTVSAVLVLGGFFLVL